MSKDTEVKATANALAEALSFLRNVERTRDYFSGYSLAEVIQERLTDIGDPDNLETPPEKYDDIPNVPTRGGGSILTKLSQLNKLRLELLGEDGKGGALGVALGLIKKAGDDGVEFRKQAAEEAE